MADNEVATCLAYNDLQVNLFTLLLSTLHHHLLLIRF